MHAMLISHFQRGGSYPVGGASEIAFHMIPIIERAGGKVLVRVPVTKILTDDQGRACGIICFYLFFKKGESTHLSHVIVFNTDTLP